MCYYGTTGGQMEEMFLFFKFFYLKYLIIIFNDKRQRTLTHPSSATLTFHSNLSNLKCTLSEYVKNENFLLCLTYRDS